MLDANLAVLFGVPTGRLNEQGKRNRDRFPDRYIEGLTRFRGNGVVPWIEHFAEAVTRSANLATRYLGEVQALMDGWRQRLTRSSAPRGRSAAGLRCSSGAEP